MATYYGDLRKNLAEDAYTDASGVLRWKSNDRVPPIDLLEQAGVEEPTLQRCRKASDVETARFLEAMKDYVYSQEELGEMRAAFGPGETVVDIITGRRIQL